MSAVTGKYFAFSAPHTWILEEKKEKDSSALTFLTELKRNLEAHKAINLTSLKGKSLKEVVDTVVTGCENKLEGQGLLGSLQGLVRKIWNLFLRILNKCGFTTITPKIDSIHQVAKEIRNSLEFEVSETCTFEFFKCQYENLKAYLKALPDDQQNFLGLTQQVYDYSPTTTSGYILQAKMFHGLFVRYEKMYDSINPNNVITVEGEKHDCSLFAQEKISPPEFANIFRIVAKQACLEGNFSEATDAFAIAKFSAADLFPLQVELTKNLINQKNYKDAITVLCHMPQDQIEIADALKHEIAAIHLKEKNFSTAAYVVGLMSGNVHKPVYCDTARAVFNASQGQEERYGDAIKVAFLINKEKEISRALVNIAARACDKEDFELAVSALHLVVIN